MDRHSIISQQLNIVTNLHRLILSYDYYLDPRKKRLIYPNGEIILMVPLSRKRLFACVENTSGQEVFVIYDLKDLSETYVQNRLNENIEQLTLLSDDRVLIVSNYDIAIFNPQSMDYDLFHRYDHMIHRIFEVNNFLIIADYANELTIFDPLTSSKKFTLEITITFFFGIIQISPNEICIIADNATRLNLITFNTKVLFPISRRVLHTYYTSDNKIVLIYDDLSRIDWDLTDLYPEEFNELKTNTYAQVKSYKQYMTFLTHDRGYFLWDLESNKYEFREQQYEYISDGYDMSTLGDFTMLPNNQLILPLGNEICIYDTEQYFGEPISCMNNIALSNLLMSDDILVAYNGTDIILRP